MVSIYSLARSRMNAIAIDIASWDAGLVRFHVLQMPEDSMFFNSSNL